MKKTANKLALKTDKIVKLSKSQAQQLVGGGSYPTVWKN
ncbi:MAG: class I lanthipeptide [Spirosomataceae bacterium]